MQERFNNTLLNLEFSIQVLEYFKAIHMSGRC